MSVVGSRGRSIAECPAVERSGPPLRLAGWLLVAALGVSNFGCAYSAFEGPVATSAAAAARGERFAEQDCGHCHGMGPTGASGFLGAPPFRVMRYDFNAISYERALAQDHSGRVGMPPGEMSREELADIGAYVHSLEHAARH